MRNQDFDPTALATHGRFLRGLALGLVRGEAEAEDLVQDTWLTALEKPEAATERGWLGGVARNLSRSRHRAASRREAREARAARREGSAADPVVDATVLREVVDAVLELDEPFRGAILRRYYHDQPPRDIARELDVSVSTVNSRLQRGLARLRTRLDGRHGGDRRQWIAPLAIALRPPMAGTTASWSAAAAFVLVLVVLGAASSWIVITLGDDATRREGAEERKTAQRITPTEDDEVPSFETSPFEGAVPEESESTEDEEGAEEDAPAFAESELPGRATVHGRVVFADTRECVPGAHLRFWTQTDPSAEEVREVVSTSADREGLYRWGEADWSRHDELGVLARVEVRPTEYWHEDDSQDAPWFRPKSVVVNQRMHGKHPLQVDVEVERGLVVTGIVVDAATGAAVPDALVAREKVPFGRGHPCRRTGPDGRFELSGVDAEPIEGFFVVVAGCEGWLPSRIRVPYAEGQDPPAPLTLALERGVRIAGRVLGADGDPVSDARIRAFSAGERINAAARLLGFLAYDRTAEDGSFELPAVPGGPDTVIEVEAARHPFLRVEPVDARQDVVDLELRLERGVRVAITARRRGETLEQHDFLALGTLPSGRGFRASSVEDDREIRVMWVPPRTTLTVSILMPDPDARMIDYWRLTGLHGERAVAVDTTDVAVTVEVDRKRELPRKPDGVREGGNFFLAESAPLLLRPRFPGAARHERAVPISYGHELGWMRFDAARGEPVLHRGPPGRRYVTLHADGFEPVDLQIDAPPCVITEVPVDFR